MTKIAIIGRDGMLGYDLMRSGRPADTLVGFTHSDIEITDPASVAAAFERLRPDAVINTAAITKTEFCENEPAKAFLVNAVGAYHVSRTAAEIGAAVVLVGTDYVFDGSKPSFSEDDAPRPLNVYGASKLAGEHLTRIANPRHYIIRSSWLFGKNVSRKGYNFVTLMLDKARAGEEIKAVNDQTGSPTYTRDLAEKIFEIIERQTPYGLYHITNQEQVTWHNFAQKIFELSDLNAKLVPITTAESGTKIKRPPFSVLENKRLRDLGLTPLRPWPEALAAYLDEIKK